jgi:hypothetical protein
MPKEHAEEIKNKQAPPNPPISAAAERMRRSRRRKREGLRLVQVLLRETEVVALIESGWLEDCSPHESSRQTPPAQFGPRWQNAPAEGVFDTCHKGRGFSNHPGR